MKTIKIGEITDSLVLSNNRGEYEMVILCEYCMDDKWIGDGRTPCPKCNPDGEIAQQGWDD